MRLASRNRFYRGEHGVLRAVFVDGNFESIADDLELLNRGGTI
jgi:hypothetical protein